MKDFYPFYLKYNNREDERERKMCTLCELGSKVWVGGWVNASYLEVLFCITVCDFAYSKCVLRIHVLSCDGSVSWRE